VNLKSEIGRFGLSVVGGSPASLGMADCSQLDMLGAWTRRRHPSSLARGRSGPHWCTTTVDWGGLNLGPGGQRDVCSAPEKLPVLVVQVRRAHRRGTHAQVFLHACAGDVAHVVRVAAQKFAGRLFCGGASCGTTRTIERCDLVWRCSPGQKTRCRA